MSQDTPARKARYERHLMRQRGAGPRNISIDFGFSFDFPSIAMAAAEPPLEFALEPPSKRIRVCSPINADAIGLATATCKVFEPESAPPIENQPREHEGDTSNQSIIGVEELNESEDDHGIPLMPADNRRSTRASRARARQGSKQNKIDGLFQSGTEAKQPRARRIARVPLTEGCNKKETKDPVQRGVEPQIKKTKRRTAARPAAKPQLSKTAKARNAHQGVLHKSPMLNESTEASTLRSPGLSQVMSCARGNRLPLQQTDANIVRKSVSPEKPTEKLERQMARNVIPDDERPSATHQNIAIDVYGNAQETRQTRKVSRIVGSSQVSSLAANRKRQATQATSHHKKESTHVGRSHELVANANESCAEPLTGSDLRGGRAARNEAGGRGARNTFASLQKNAIAPQTSVLGSFQGAKVDIGDLSKDGKELDWLLVPAHGLCPAIADAPVTRRSCKRKAYLEVDDIDLDDLVANITSIAAPAKSDKGVPTLTQVARRGSRARKG